MAHINIEISVNAWMDWALTANIHHSITSFIKFRPTHLYQFDPKVDADTFPCPRTWGMAAQIVDTVGMNSAELPDLLCATLSDGPAREYINYCKNFVGLPTYDQIIKDPKGTPIPEGMSTMYALSGSIGAQVTADTVADAMVYIERMPKEFQLRTFTDFTKREPSLVVVPAVRTWLTANAREMARS